jgi:hypothetical protein
MVQGAKHCVVVGLVFEETSGSNVATQEPLQEAGFG